ncbi:MULTISPECIES: hypothetical protein [unclassified Modestobacter]
MSADEDNRGTDDIAFAPGRGDAEQADAERIFAAPRATGSARRRQAAPTAPTRDGNPAPMLPLCPVLLADAHVCLLPLVDEHDCPHRQPGAAPAAVADLVTELRRQVGEARTVAGAVAAELRHLLGDRGLAAVLHEDPWWLVPGR